MDEQPSQPVVVLGVPIGQPDTAAPPAPCSAPSAPSSEANDANLSRVLQENEDAALAARLQGEEVLSDQARRSQEVLYDEAAAYADAMNYHHGYYYRPTRYRRPFRTVYVQRPVTYVGVRPNGRATRAHRDDWHMEECAYCEWETQVFSDELRFRCGNCGRDQAVGTGCTVM